MKVAKLPLDDERFWPGIFVGVIVAGWFIAEIILPAAIRGYSPPSGITEGLGIASGIVIAHVAAKHAAKLRSEDAEIDNKDEDEKKGVDARTQAQPEKGGA